jgi:ABC-type protease/lipase transport system fused ATPase/permease subunit
LLTGEAERDRNSIVTTAAPQGRLTVEHVSYTRNARQRPILRDISFAVQPGEMLVVVGPSASGKTTLARLLLGVIKPSLGAVRLDGLDVFRWNRDDFGYHVGYLPQSVSLLPGTVRDNIARFREASNEDVIAAAEMVGIHETIARLPKAYDTELDDTASQLSGGQRQLIGLARAVFGDPKLVVLDEPNSNLDSFGEAALLNAVRGLRAAGCTVVLITHKRALMDMADRVLALRDGSVQFFGTIDQARSASARPAGPEALGTAEAQAS